MRYMRCLTILLTGICIASSLAARAGANADSAFNFLSIGEGARPAGMGEAFTALTDDDVNALYWNPAGLGAIRSTQATSSYLQYLVDVNIGYAACALPALKGGLGLGVLYVDYGDIKALTYDDPSVAQGYYRPYDLMLTAGYGTDIDGRCSIGLNIKGIQEEIKGYTARAIALDAGLLYRTPVDGLTVGAVLQNMGTQTRAFIEELHTLPVTGKVGIGYGLLEDSLKLALDYYHSGDDRSGVNGGIEYLFKHTLAVRFGYQTGAQDLKTGSSSDSVTGFTAGLGIRYGCLSVDYAFVPYNELGQTQRISLSARFDGKPGGNAGELKSKNE